MSGLDARTVSAALANYHSRVVDVELTATLTFRMREVHPMPRHGLWSRLWPSSIAVSRWLLAEPELADSGRELGCGLGLVSMALAHRGVNVEATDRVAHALAFSTYNAEHNAVRGFSVGHLDWSEPQGAPSALIVAADVMYEPESPARLFSLLHTAGMLRPEGRLVLGVPRRRAEFYAVLHQRLIDADYAHSVAATTVAWDGEHDAIDVHVLRRPLRDRAARSAEPGPE